MTGHWVPYTAPSPSCDCAQVACGGLLSNPDCVEHGARKEPAMQRHDAGGRRCRALGGVPEPKRYRCDRGHFLPADFRPPFHRDPDDWDDTCESKCRRPT